MGSSWLTEAVFLAVPLSDHRVEEGRSHQKVTSAACIRRVKIADAVEGVQAFHIDDACYDHCDQPRRY